MNVELKVVDVHDTVPRTGYTWTGYALLAAAIVIGIVVRFKGIGRWAFTDDEFYIAQSVKFILNSGLPAFESGGYYTRSLLYQYIAAGFVAFFSNAEFWLRAIPAAFNLLSVPALFWLGRRIGGKIVACTAVILFMLSVWEIEFSRFARMYAIFQTVFLWYLVALYKVLMDEDRSYEKWMYLLSAAAPLVYEGAILLTILNFLPIIHAKKVKSDWTRFWVPMLIFIGAYLFLSYDFRRMGLNDYLPDDLADTMVGQKGKVFFPVLMLPTIFANAAWAVSFLATVSIAGWAGYTILTSGADYRVCAGFLIMIISALLHHFGLMIGCAVVLVSLYYTRYDFNWKKSKAPLLISITASFSYWILYGLTTGWYQFYPEIDDPSFRKYLFLLFNYPNVYGQILWQWLKVMPVLSILLGTATSAAFVKALSHQRERNAGYLFLIAILVMMILMVGMLRTPLGSTRYTFFLYPVIILTGAAAVSMFARWLVKNETWYGLVFAVVIFAYIGVAEDYKFNHLYKIDSPEINFRTGISRDLALHYYHRLDYRTPADIVNSRAGRDEVIVTIFTPTAYYLDRIDYVYLDSVFHSWIESAYHGKKELWTNAHLLRKEQQLWDLIQNSATPVWIIAGSEKNDRNVSVKNISRAIKDRYSSFLVGSSIDQKLLVYHVLPENLDYSKIPITSLTPATDRKNYDR